MQTIMMVMAAGEKGGRGKGENCFKNTEKCLKIACFGSFYEKLYPCFQ